mmetsp:Transcript_68904/g.138534  ORF Transcript_68904/g.138534 Transcript_68904/m.138534 type:complete len:414 (-) Transcript_68904:97-1338(-)|eukprot:CAMPEP_0171793170 /NCGR_PEP_ID=MMETSP0991-20121206/67400_1 /TAXON_ID=483369 /ORGANISM="non described non described, Strain CCMP2098" /LENGTH=413 /DNA_ID=CAMNT_0012403389 /DNA_START=41 /DNA_END=1282 /DNA_ORIENTATION=+
MIQAYLETKPWVNPQLWLRAQCPSCAVHRRFYCFYCKTLVAVPSEMLPTILSADPLPLTVDVILRDEPSKSTGIYAAVMAPQSTRVVRYPEDLEDSSVGAEDTKTSSNNVAGESTRDRPEIEYDPRTTVILYPSERSVTMGEIPVAELAQLRKVLVVDTTWQKTGGVLLHRKLRHLRHIRLANPPEESLFWRYHNQGAGRVSTIEALVLVLSEFRAACCPHRETAGTGMSPKNLQAGPSFRGEPVGRTAQLEDGTRGAGYEHHSDDNDNVDNVGGGGGDGGGVTLHRSVDAVNRVSTGASSSSCSISSEFSSEFRLLLIFGLVADAIKLDYAGEGREVKRLGVRQGARAGNSPHAALLPMDEKAKEHRRLHRRQQGSERQVRQKEISEAARQATGLGTTPQRKGLRCPPSPVK